MLVLIGACWRRCQQHRALTGSVDPRTVVAFVTAGALVLLVANKVLSPQYLLWVVPFAVLLAPPLAWLALLASALTIVVYPVAYDALLGGSLEAILLLCARNTVLVVLLAAVVIRGGAWPRRAPRPWPRRRWEAVERFR
jgi:hypothetical protein